MDKFEKVLDIIDHQEKYSDEEIHAILQDGECRKFYQTMQEVDSALLKRDAQVNVNEEWQKFDNEHFTNGHSGRTWRKMVASFAGFVLVSGIAIAAIHTYIKRSQEPKLISDDNRVMAMAKDSLKQNAAKDSLQLQAKVEKPSVHKTFVNVAFDKMISEIASYYDMQVKFDNAETKNLRLYYEWDSHSSIESIVKDLNQFENVNIELEGSKIIIK